MVSTCNNGTLAIYFPSNDQDWNRIKVQHLFRRIGFGVSSNLIQSYLSQNPDEIIDNIISDVLNMEISDPPEWSDYNIFSYYTNNAFDFELLIAHFREYQLSWTKEMFDFDKAVREKLTLFWSNHFTTIFSEYECTPSMYQYHKLLQERSFGNFKSFVYEMGLNPAMLLFLDGASNVKEDTNENYARELFELYTLGQNIGYTQQDIEETARALTGWTTDNCVDVYFNEDEFDEGSKTIFGKTGNWGYDDLINILFEERATEIAQFICTKLYKFYVSDEVDTQIIDELANIFINENWEIAPVLRTLWKSEHFFNEAVYGNKIKSPAEIMIGFLKEIDFEMQEENFEVIPDVLAYSGQSLFNPPDVAGWKGNRDWIDNNTLTQRWEILTVIAFSIFNEHPEHYQNFVTNIVSSDNDPVIIVQEVVDYFLPNGFNNIEEYQVATTVFKAGIPENYFENGYWNLNWEQAPYQVGVLLLHIFKQPEFQLC